MRRACTKAWGRLPRSWCSATSNSSAKRPGEPAGRTGPLEPAHTVQRLAGMEAGQGQPEVADQEGTFGGGQLRTMMPIPIDVPVLGQLVDHRPPGGPTPRVVGSHCSADLGQQERGVDPRVIGRTLPAAGLVHTVGAHRGCDRVGQGEVGGRAIGRNPGPGNGPQAGNTDEPAVGPVLGLELPDAGVGLDPASSDGRGGPVHGLPAFRAKAVSRGGQRQQKQRFPEGVELELIGDPIPDYVIPPGIAGEVQLLYLGDRAAITPIGRCQVIAVGQQTGRDPSDRVVEHRLSAIDRRAGSAHVAGVPDPDVAVVVVAIGLSPLGQRGRDCRHRASVRPRQAPQDREGPANVPGCRHSPSLWNRGAPRLFRRPPKLVRIGGLVTVGRVGVHQLQDEVVALTRLDLAGERKPVVTSGADQ